MNSEIRKTLEAVKNGELSVDDALLAIKKEPFEDIGYAKVDLAPRHPSGRGRGDLRCRKDTRADGGDHRSHAGT